MCPAPQTVDKTTSNRIWAIKVSWGLLNFVDPFSKLTNNTLEEKEANEKYAGTNRRLLFCMQLITVEEYAESTNESV